MLQTKNIVKALRVELKAITHAHVLNKQELKKGSKNYSIISAVLTDKVRITSLTIHLNRLRNRPPHTGSEERDTEICHEGYIKMFEEKYVLDTVNAEGE
jgi:hypothetical protein